jgi:Tyrosine phosphatase family
MIAFLKHMEEAYGGAENYVKQYVGLSDEDIETVKRNLLVPKEDTQS